MEEWRCREEHVPSHRALELSMNPVLSGIRARELGLRADSAGTGDFCQTSQLKLDFWEPHSGRRELTLAFLNCATRLCGFLCNLLASQLGLVTTSNSEVMVRIKLGIVLIEDALIIQGSG